MVLCSWQREFGFPQINLEDDVLGSSGFEECSRCAAFIIDGHCFVDLNQKRPTRCYSSERLSFAASIVFVRLFFRDLNVSNVVRCS